MFKKVTFLFIVSFSLMTAGTLFAEEQDAKEQAESLHKIQEKMRASPDLVTPDSIYVTTELKAIYYQNSQAIELLRQIRDILKEQSQKKDN